MNLNKIIKQIDLFYKKSNNVEQAIKIRKEINSGSLKGLLRDAVNKVATSKGTLKANITDIIEKQILESREQEFKPILDRIALAKQNRDEFAKKAAFSELAIAINRKAINNEAEMHEDIINHVTKIISRFEIFFNDVRKIMKGKINQSDEEYASTIKYGNNLYLEFINKKLMSSSADAVRKICILLKENII